MIRRFTRPIPEARPASVARRRLVRSRWEAAGSSILVSNPDDDAPQVSNAARHPLDPTGFEHVRLRRDSAIGPECVALPRPRRLHDSGGILFAGCPDKNTHRKGLAPPSRWLRIPLVATALRGRFNRRGSTFAGRSRLEHRGYDLTDLQCYEYDPAPDKKRYGCRDANPPEQVEGVFAFSFEISPRRGLSTFSEIAHFRSVLGAVFWLGSSFGRTPV